MKKVSPEPEEKAMTLNTDEFPAELLSSPFMEAHEPLFIENIAVHKKQMELNSPFETSFGRFDRLTKLFPVITFRTAGGSLVTGTGECPPLPAPWYDGECDGTVAVALDFIITSLTAGKEGITDPASFIRRYSWIVGHNMAKNGIEGAYWDAVGRLHDVPVWKLWGGTRKSVESGVSIGLEETPGSMMKKVSIAVEDLKVKRVKIKIKPGKDIHYVEAVRSKYPELRLQVDANAAYDLFNREHVGALKELDHYKLTMIEQPGRNNDILDHARRLAGLATPVCLDESIIDAADARKAIECWQLYSSLSRLIINIKPPRVGGFLEAIKIARLCAHHGICTWCGGMLESALGKTSNIHFSSRAEVNLPGDHVSFGPYFREDVADSPSYRDGMIEVPEKAGWGLGELKF